MINDVISLDLAPPPRPPWCWGWDVFMESMGFLSLWKWESMGIIPWICIPSDGKFMEIRSWERQNWLILWLGIDVGIAARIMMKSMNHGKKNPLMTSLMKSATPLSPAPVARLDFGPEKKTEVIGKLGSCSFTGSGHVLLSGFWKLVEKCDLTDHWELGLRRVLDTWLGKWWVFKKICQHEGQFRAKFVQ